MTQILYPDQVSKLLNILAKHKTHVVGGFVRDILLGLPTNDIDLVTPHALSDFLPTIEILAKKPYIIPKYHAVMFRFLDYKVTLTRLRKDIACDGRQAEVAFVETLAEDVYRRDFTINALYSDLTGHVIDYVNGLQDLHNQHIHFIGDPEQRIREDVLRILRYVRFCSLFETDMDDYILKIAELYMPKLRALPKEKLNYEVKRILKAPYGQKNWQKFINCCGELTDP